MAGYIYLIHSPKQQVSKIGYCSQDPEIRRKKLQTSNSDPLELVQFVVGTRATEGAIHSALAKYRTAGEWFSEPDLMRMIFEDFYEISTNMDDEQEPLTQADALDCIQKMTAYYGTPEYLADCAA